MWKLLLLFILLSPGVLITLPPIGNKIFRSEKTNLLAVCVHAVLFVIAARFLRIYEGFAAPIITNANLSCRQGTYLSSPTVIGRTLGFSSSCIACPSNAYCPGNKSGYIKPGMKVSCAGNDGVVNTINNSVTSLIRTNGTKINFSSPSCTTLDAVAIPVISGSRLSGVAPVVAPVVAPSTGSRLSGVAPVVAPSTGSRLSGSSIIQSGPASVIPSSGSRLSNPLTPASTSGSYTTSSGAVLMPGMLATCSNHDGILYSIDSTKALLKNPENNHNYPYPSSTCSPMGPLPFPIGTVVHCTGYLANFTGPVLSTSYGGTLLQVRLPNGNFASGRTSSCSPVGSGSSAPSILSSILSISSNILGSSSEAPSEVLNPRLEVLTPSETITTSELLSV